MKILTFFGKFLFIVASTSLVLLLLVIIDKNKNVSASISQFDEKMLADIEGTEQHAKNKMKKERGGSINEEHTWMDGLAADVEMNCPSLKWIDSDEFNPPKKEVTSSLRCATCNVMKELMLRRAQLLVLKGRKPSTAFIMEGDDDGTKTTVNNFAGTPFCEALYESYQLRERPDGQRVWTRRYANDEEAARFGVKLSSTSNSGKSNNDNEQVSPDERKTKQILEDRASLMKTHLVSSNVNIEDERRKEEEVDPSKLLPVKYHTPNARRTLPCARFFLKQLCFKEVESREESIDKCFDGAVPHIDAFRKKKASNSKTTDIDNNNQNGREEWVEFLDKCLSKALNCEKKFCHVKAVVEARKREWLRFAWYEGCFGNQKFAYVPDWEQRGRNMLNPYRKGGEKKKENPWLNGTWVQVQDASSLFPFDW